MFATIAFFAVEKKINHKKGAKFHGWWSLGENPLCTPAAACHNGFKHFLREDSFCNFFCQIVAYQSRQKKLIGLVQLNDVIQ